MNPVPYIVLFFLLMLIWTIYRIARQRSLQEEHEQRSNPLQDRVTSASRALARLEADAPVNAESYGEEPPDAQRRHDRMLHQLEYELSRTDSESEAAECRYQIECLEEDWQEALDGWAYQLKRASLVSELESAQRALSGETYRWAEHQRKRQQNAAMWVGAATAVTVASHEHSKHQKAAAQQKEQLELMRKIANK